MSNHFHLVLKADDNGSISDFVGLFQSRLARQVNKRIDRTGPVWQRRFSAIPIVDEGALEERIAYTILNPVRANLVQNVDKWPGLVSHRCDGQRNLYRVESASLKAGFRRMKQRFDETSAHPMGVRKLLAQSLSKRPKSPKRRRAPLRHASDAFAQQRFLSERKMFYAAYRVAADAYRESPTQVVFPAGCHPPSRYPKLALALAA